MSELHWKVQWQLEARWRMTGKYLFINTAPRPGMGEASDPHQFIHCPLGMMPGAVHFAVPHGTGGPNVLPSLPYIKKTEDTVQCGGLKTSHLKRSPKQAKARVNKNLTTVLDLTFV